MEPIPVELLRAAMLARRRRGAVAAAQMRARTAAYAAAVLALQLPRP